MLAIGTVCIEGWRTYRFVTPHSERILIPTGASLQKISLLLKNQNLIWSSFCFEWWVRLSYSQAPLKAGEYEIPQGVLLQDLIERLQKGESITYGITIPEGLMSLEIKELLLKDVGLQGEIKDLPEEGTLLPETYHYHKPYSRQNLLDRMGEAQKALLEELWPRRGPDLPIQTPLEALILASIVERETSLDSERRHIAGVFLNRLKKKMPLQSDPTVRYGLYKRDAAPFEGRLYNKHLQTVTPYNTYEIQGLPPGPICHPGRASIEAVLNPDSTKDLYFVADGSGGHVFSKTYQEHQKNHAAWRRLRRQQP